MGIGRREGETLVAEDFGGAKCRLQLLLIGIYLLGKSCHKVNKRRARLSKTFNHLEQPCLGLTRYRKETIKQKKKPRGYSREEKNHSLDQSKICENSRFFLLQLPITITYHESIPRILRSLSLGRLVGVVGRERVLSRGWEVAWLFVARLGRLLAGRVCVPGMFSLTELHFPRIISIGSFHDVLISFHDVLVSSRLHGGKKLQSFFIL